MCLVETGMRTEETEVYRKLYVAQDLLDEIWKRAEGERKKGET